MWWAIFIDLLPILPTDPRYLNTKSLYISRAVNNFYGTEIEIQFVTNLVNWPTLYLNTKSLCRSRVVSNLYGIEIWVSFGPIGNTKKSLGRLWITFEACYWQRFVTNLANRPTLSKFSWNRNWDLRWFWPVGNIEKNGRFFIFSWTKKIKML